MRTIGVGLIGTGHMGKCHALAWTGVHAVFDDTPIVRRVMLCVRSRKGWRGDGPTSSASRRRPTTGACWIADPGVEVVSITTPNALHAPMAIAAHRSGQACVVRKADGAFCSS